MPAISHIGSRGIPGHRGGVERVLEALAPRLVEHGYDVTVYCASWSTYKEPSYKGVKRTVVPSVRSKYFDTIIRSFLATVRECFSSTQIVHYHSSGSAPLAILARLFRKKVIVTVHGLDSQRRKWNIFGRWFLRLGEWAAVKLPNRTVAVGLDIKKQLEGRYQVPVAYIANGAEPRTIRKPEQIKSLGIDARDYVLFLARIVPEKRCDLLVDAYQKLENRHGKKLVIAGPTWHSTDYVARIKAKTDGDPSIIMTGEVDEATLEELYFNCFAYVLPSEVEGMSLALLDALAFGACIVASDIPANTAVLDDAGVAFRSGDVDDLSNKLRDLLENPGRAEELRNAAKARFTSTFDWDRIADEWDALYKDALRSL